MILKYMVFKFIDKSVIKGSKKSLLIYFLNPVNFVTI